jgi:hypothetical protein
MCDNGTRKKRPSIHASLVVYITALLLLDVASRVLLVVNQRVAVGKTGCYLNPVPSIRDSLVKCSRRSRRSPCQLSI